MTWPAAGYPPICSYLTRPSFLLSVSLILHWLAQPTQRSLGVFTLEPGCRTPKGAPAFCPQLSVVLQQHGLLRFVFIFLKTDFPGSLGSHVLVAFPLYVPIPEPNPWRTHLLLWGGVSIDTPVLQSR